MADIPTKLPVGTAFVEPDGYEKVPEEPTPKGPGRPWMDPERLDEIAAELIKNRPHHSIAQTFSRKWGLTERQVRNYITRVYERWREESQAARGFEAEIRKRQWLEFHEHCKAAGDHKTAANALDKASRIEGVYAPIVAQVHHEGGLGVLTLSADKIHARIAELAAKRQIIDVGYQIVQPALLEAAGEEDDALPESGVGLDQDSPSESEDEEGPA